MRFPLLIHKINLFEAQSHFPKLFSLLLEKLILNHLLMIKSLIIEEYLSSIIHFIFLCSINLRHLIFIQFQQWLFDSYFLVFLFLFKFHYLNFLMTRLFLMHLRFPIQYYHWVPLIRLDKHGHFQKHQITFTPLLEFPLQAK